MSPVHAFEFGCVLGAAVVASAIGAIIYYRFRIKSKAEWLAERIK